jgi:alginate lyase
MFRTALLGAALVLAVSAVSACGESTAPPPVPPTPAPTPAPAGPPQVPGQLLDLTNWKLTLPTGQEGKPEEIVQPALSSFTDDFFRLNDARDGVVFTATAGGVTTSGSSYPRSELREMNGQELASWSNTTGTHTLRLREAVTLLPAVKPHVVAAQIHVTRTTT